MGTDREALAMPSFDDMDDFAPRQSASGAPQAAGQGAPMPATAPTETRRAIDAVSAFPSREGPADGQLNLKGPRPVLDRFRALCKSDRRAYYDMLEILMDCFEERQKQ